MHPLRLWLYVSLAIAIAVGYSFAAALLHARVPAVEAYILGGTVFAIFMLPWSGVFMWAIRRAEGLERLIVRTRGIATGEDESSIDESFYREEVQDLARAVEEVRVLIMRERAWSEEQRATMQQIAAALSEGLLAFSPRGRIVLANDRVRQMLGARGEIVGRPLVEVMRNQRLIAAFERAVAGEASTDRITLEAAGAGRHIELRVSPVMNSTDVAAVALFIDVTDIERLQRIRKDFLDDFSHEVRTPLAGFRSAAETLEQGGLTSQEEEQLREIMLRQLSRIEHLVRDLSELSRIESGELVLKREIVDIRDLLAELCREFRERITPGAVSIAVRGQHAWAEVDSLRIQQIFSNLLDNAWKHGGGRGEILVEVATESGEVVIRVSDEGEGIPPAELDRIFNRFYRIDKSRSQNVPGTGLGLAITRHLVLLHGGSIRAHNRPGGGATLEVRLPAAEVPAAAAPITP
jgi:two-component system, OmpR family, phosphate regulon sensor histidine kinase PhoR